MSARSSPENGTDPFMEQSQSPTIRYSLPTREQWDAGAGTPFLDALRAIQKTESKSQIKARAKRAQECQKLFRRHHGLHYQPCCEEHVPKSRPPTQYTNYRHPNRNLNAAENNPRAASDDMAADVYDPFIVKTKDQDLVTTDSGIDDNNGQCHEEDSHYHEPHGSDPHEEDSAAPKVETPGAKNNPITFVLALRERAASI